MLYSLRIVNEFLRKSRQKSIENRRNVRKTTYKLGELVRKLKNVLANHSFNAKCARNLDFLVKTAKILVKVRKITISHLFIENLDVHHAHCFKFKQSICPRVLNESTVGSYELHV